MFSSSFLLFAISTYFLMFARFVQNPASNGMKLLRTSICFSSSVSRSRLISATISGHSDASQN